MSELTQNNTKLVERVITSLSDFAVTRAAIVPKLMRMTADVNTSIQELGTVLAQDPALAATVLRVANSAYYGRLRKVASLTEAVNILGLTLMRSLAVAASLNSILRDCSDKHAMQRLWDHSLAVAIAARLTARTTQAVNAEEAFLAGLMHDLAKLVLLQRFPAEYAPVVNAAREGRTDLRRIERDALGIAHDQLGALILGQWNFPPHLIEAVRRHHEPDSHELIENRGCAVTESRNLAYIVAFANTLAQARGIGFADRETTLPEDSPLIAFLDLSPEAVLQISEDMSLQSEEERALYVI